MTELETEVKLLKRDVEDTKVIHGRLDVAIDKLTDVSNSIHRMLAVHEEKLARQEEASYELEKQIEVRRSELLNKIDDLHSRITTNTKEIMVSAREQHEKQNIEILRYPDDVLIKLKILTKKTLDEEATKLMLEKNNPRFNRVYDAYEGFRVSYELWGDLSDKAYQESLKLE